LADAKTITVAKGKKILTLSPASDTKQDILKAVMGPSGNLRAPALRKGKNWTIGFHPEVYKNF
jgi:arsenate reductase-like glutaredoxin family protein